MKVNSANEIWWGTDSGRIVRFDGISNYSIYLIDSNFKIISFLNDENNDLLLFAACTLNNENIICFYKFQYSDWVRVYTVIYPNQNQRIIQPDQIVQNIFGHDSLHVYKFINNNFTSELNFPSDLFPLYYLSGSNINDLFIGGYISSEIQDKSYGFQWNGIKWSKEFITYPGTFTGNSKKINEKYFCVVESEYYSITYIYKGTMKKMERR
jgi:hypothetical protein